MTIEEIKKQQLENNAEKDAILKEIAGLLEQEQTISREADAAAEQGDVDTYIKKSSLLDRIKATIHVKRVQQEKAANLGVTMDDAKSAWDAYQRKYEKDFKRCAENVQKANEAAAEAFLELCDFQNKALENRESLANLMGGTDSDARNMFPLEMHIDASESCWYHNVKIPICAALCIMLGKKPEDYFSYIINGLACYRE